MTDYEQYCREIDPKAKIGKGAFGIVYAVGPKQEYAAKHIANGIVKDMYGVYEYAPEVDSEIRLLEMLRGRPCVVQLLYYTMIKREAVLLFPRYDKSLDKFIKGIVKGTILRATNDTLKFLMADMCTGLRACHEAGVYACDIKPDNMLVRYHESYSDPSNKKSPEYVTERPALVLTDFGNGSAVKDYEPNYLALFEKEYPNYIQHSGTYSFLAPECLGPRHYAPTKAIDYWALGLTIADMYLLERCLVETTYDSTYWNLYYKRVTGSEGSLCPKHDPVELDMVCVRMQMHMIGHIAIARLMGQSMEDVEDLVTSQTRICMDGVREELKRKGGQIITDNVHLHDHQKMAYSVDLHDLIMKSFWSDQWERLNVDFMVLEKAMGDVLWKQWLKMMVHVPAARSLPPQM
jgi:serine/threonine protein kinase